MRLSYGYRVQILFRLLRVTRRLAQQLEVGLDIRFPGAGERVTWLDMIQFERLPRHPAPIPRTPPPVAGLHLAVYNLHSACQRGRLAKRASHAQSDCPSKPAVDRPESS